jgi:hypothetical protein
MALSSSRLSRSTSIDNAIELERPAPERLELSLTPHVEMVANFFLTRAARRSWEVLNEHLSGPDGGIFWIGGPAGCGKTHFLNYVIALQNRAGVMTAENERRLVCGLEISGQVRAAEVEFYLLSLLAEKIGSDPRSSALWREMNGPDALAMALESARRTNIRTLTVAIDFGLSEFDSAPEFFANLAIVAARCKSVKFTVIAAGRSPAPESASGLEVAPRDANEDIAAAIRRARRIVPEAEQPAREVYRGIEIGEFTPEAIFPFHPITLDTVRSIAAPTVSVASLALLFRECLVVFPNARAKPTLIYPAAILGTQAISKRLDLRLGDNGRAALKIARDCLQHFSGVQRKLASELTETLAVAAAIGSGAAILLRELKGRLPILAGKSAADDSDLPMMQQVLRQLEAQSGGVIRLDGEAARFDPLAAGAAEVAVFNRMLSVTRRFDSALTAARDIEELGLRLHRLDRALAAAAEAAQCTLAVLSTAFANSGTQIPEQYRRAIGNYATLAEAGASAILDIAANSALHADALATISAYESLETVAAMVPRMRAMREYLAATELHAIHSDLRINPIVSTLETECELLGVELGPRFLTHPSRQLEALEARFQKFKWTYVQYYLAAHEDWRIEMDRLAAIADDVRGKHAALTRLNSIVALGAPEGAELKLSVGDIEARVVRCDLDAPLAPEITPRCIDCGFRLGSSSPRESLSDLQGRLDRALATKLAALSQNMIARLIREHGDDHRLDGFLKVVQAAQIDALVNVLDDQLARYLSEALDENLRAPEFDRSSLASKDETPTLKSVKQSRKKESLIGDAEPQITSRRINR